MDRNEIIKKIEDTKVISIIRGIKAEDAVKAAKALYDGGVELVEVTFDQRSSENFFSTAEAIRDIKAEMGERMVVGAGTVLTEEQLLIAKNAGAQFIVSPDTNENIIKKTVEFDMVSLPGAFTPTEAIVAHNAGADFVKLFPCVGDAVQYLKALRAPCSHIKFLAVGGVSVDNVADFITAGACGVGVGSCLVNKKWVEIGEFSKITATAKQLIKNIKSAEA